MLTVKIIDIMADLWKHRDKTLHKRDNVVRQRDHNRLNNQIQHLTKCKIRQKQQWINTAQSIINGFKKNLHSNPQARTMFISLLIICSSTAYQLGLMLCNAASC